VKADRRQKHKGADAAAVVAAPRPTRPSAPLAVLTDLSIKNCSVAVAFALIKRGKIG